MMSESKIKTASSARLLERPEDVLRWIGEIIRAAEKLPVAGQNFQHGEIFAAPHGRDLFMACHQNGWIEDSTNISASLSPLGADVLRALEEAAQAECDRVSPTTTGRWVQRLDRWAARQERYFPFLARPLFRLLGWVLATLGWIVAAYFALLD